MKKILLFLNFCFISSHLLGQYIQTDVLIIGGGTSGVTAGIQSARLGARTIIVEETPWLGGMLTSAGVPATDGNHELPSGLWGEFRDSLRARYGSAKALATGWVSNTQFEPHVGADIFKNMAAKEAPLKVFMESKFLSLKRVNPSKDVIPNIEGGWTVTVKDKKGKTITIDTRILVDATELGDIAKAAGVKYRIGTDDGNATGETDFAVAKTNVVQDMTYVAIMKDYGGNAPAIPMPKGYNMSIYDCSCGKDCSGEKVIQCDKMIDYGKLPNDKYMLNWRIFGNDYYANIIDADEKTRKKAYDEAKQKTLGFMYYIQQELGYKNLGIATDEFPTPDYLPFYPYHRESRRTEGLVTMTVNHILKPFEQVEPLYRTGIAVGDYPIDHHHAAFKGTAPQMFFPKVPSFNVPLGSLIPKDVDDFIVAEKSISVTNIVNGSTRLQPCVMLIGQAAGVLAAMCSRENIATKKVSIRRVQELLLLNKAYLMPYNDVKPTNIHFNAIQKIGITGLLRGKGEPHEWANRTWFYPDSVVTMKTFFDAFSLFMNDAAPSSSPSIPETLSETPTKLTTNEVIEMLWRLANVMNIDLGNYSDLEDFKKIIAQDWAALKLGDFDKNKTVKRAELAVLIDFYLDPFHKKEVDWKGFFK